MEMIPWKYLWSQKVIKFILFLIVLGLFSCHSDAKKEIGLYESGEARYKVPLKNGLKHGELEEYFETGELYGTSKWVDGKLHGESVVYYKNGNKKQINHFRNGIRCCESRFFLEDGSLREIQYIDEKGRLIDYKKFKRDGSQDLDIGTREAIFITDTDTVRLGGYYEAKVKLGNKEYNSLEGHLGNPKDRKILFSEKLPKIDSVTLKLKIKATKLGKNEISGVLVDIDKNHRKEMVIVPFQYFYFVKP